MEPDNQKSETYPSQFRVDEDGSAVVFGPIKKGLSSDLRCRFGGTGEEMPCEPDEDGELRCLLPKSALTGAQLQGEQTHGYAHAQLLMEVLDGQKRVASHLVPARLKSNAEQQGLQDEGLAKGSITVQQYSGAQGMPVITDNPLAHDKELSKEEALALEVAGANGGPPDDGSKPPKDDGKVTYSYSALKPFIIMSSSYLLFTITDGAIRTIILFHAHNLGFTAMEVAIMFMAYELAGVVTNLMAGVMGAKWGIKTTLLTGLLLQIVGCCILMAWQDSWGNEGGIF
ncbi:hypothetical protein DUNSADRAFT_14739 [Dunaliella salina]|uniref:Uncharacterized protein n=1 Tax=Dunaliella salina TaxID=3046 RepID=A0ABQ7G6T8_DUNSA|nr:hypothetical protein DUNSADRAFT_14739 [Dunaliella salina]|eukprot:KAF5830328.1 hypothetical protein DUNSADRAFT_14739 [Dunaliella salina]